MTSKRIGTVSLWLAAACLVSGWVYFATDDNPDAGPLARNLERVAPPENPPAHPWATPVPLAGVANCYKVSETLYRGEQPTAAGFKALQQMGIKTVVNLRAFHSDRDDLKGLALRYEAIPLFTWHVEAEDAVRFLKIVSDPANAPVFVHCQHGSDRTGTMCAIYRMVVDGWTRQEAIDEMTRGGFGFHEIWENLVEFLDGVDIEAIRRAAGLPDIPRE